MLEQNYYGHGKLLLTSEYFVLDGAKALALPCKFGQTMHVRYRRSDSPKLIWKSFDSEGKLWLQAEFDLWRFRILSGESEAVLTLQKILQQARKQNIHFLREEVDTLVETQLEFPLDWGLGSSSTLLYNVAQWAYISPFELSAKTFGGSGYDIACAQSMGPIVYTNSSRGPSWQSINFNPMFKDHLYFVHLNCKQDSQKQVRRYRGLSIENKAQIIKKLNEYTEAIIDCLDLGEFETYVHEHENLLSSALDMPRVQDQYFDDFWGSVKSLGAWGGDFVMLSSDRSEDALRTYLARKGFHCLHRYEDMVVNNLDARFSTMNLPSEKFKSLQER